MKFTNIATIFALVAATAYAVINEADLEAAVEKNKGITDETAFAEAIKELVSEEEAKKLFDAKDKEASELDTVIKAAVEAANAAEKKKLADAAAKVVTDNRAALKTLVKAQTTDKLEDFVTAIKGSVADEEKAKKLFAARGDDVALDAAIAEIYPVAATATNTADSTKTADSTETKSWYKNPLYIGAGVVVLGALAGGAYMLVRKSSDETDL